MTLPLGAIKEAGLFFSADAELTGEAWSALTLLLEGWTDDDKDDDEHDDDDDDTVDDDDDVWGAGMAADLVWGKNSREAVRESGWKCGNTMDAEC